MLGDAHLERGRGPEATNVAFGQGTLTEGLRACWTQQPRCPNSLRHPTYAMVWVLARESRCLNEERLFRAKEMAGLLGRLSQLVLDRTKRCCGLF